jgi:DNA-binding PadR family transcriptional regulator
MSLPHALLGLINYVPATGYELKTKFEQSIHFFWNAALPQIYRTLNEMEGKGWLASTVEHQEGKPSRKVYRLTDSGREEFLRWLEEPTEVPEHRHPFLIKVFFGNQLGAARFTEHLTLWRRYYEGMSERYQAEAAPTIEHYAEATGATVDALYWTLTLDYGRRFARMNVEWCTQALKELGRLQELQAGNDVGPQQSGDSRVSPEPAPDNGEER